MVNIKSEEVTDEEANLYEAILTLNTLEECFSFFRDLCTPTEIQAMAERWRVTKLLWQDKLSYREIHSKTGVSMATIGRVARFLKQEPYQGYKIALDRVRPIANGEINSRNYLQRPTTTSSLSIDLEDELLN